MATAGSSPTEGSFKGHGLAVLRAGAAAPGASPTSCAFTHLTATFPLKLLSPSTSSRNALARSLRVAGAGANHRKEADGEEGQRQQKKAIAALYVVGYGGGLVSGDTVSLDIDVGSHCTLLLLTQGSTKVFKQRFSRGRIDGGGGTSQTFRLLVRRWATLIVLPDPVTCFKRAVYDQTQRFDLRCAATSSLVLLDWFTPGRTHYQSARRDGGGAGGEGGAGAEAGAGAGAARESQDQQREEEWAFDRYMSRNEVRVAGRVLARDIVLLERPSRDADADAIARRCRPYACFATLLLVGPDCRATRDQLLADFSHISQRVNRGSRAVVDDVVWSCSALDEAQADSLVVRVAGTTTEGVRTWLRRHLTALQSIVGDDLYRQALGS